MIIYNKTYNKKSSEYSRLKALLLGLHVYGFSIEDMFIKKSPHGPLVILEELSIALSPQPKSLRFISNKHFYHIRTL